MTWKAVSASAVGTAHALNGGHCQDTCVVEVVPGPDQAPYLVCLVSDGAGSARFAARGSDLACSTAMASIKATLRRGGGLSKGSVVDWLNAVQEAVGETAAATDAACRDYACTLLGAVVGDNDALFFQIGDGAIVVSNHTAQGAVFWPDAGPYANMTHFVTDEDALVHLYVEMASVHVEEIALFSDGLQRLALAFDSRMPHHPFFDPMFAVLRGKKPEECEALGTQLLQFLGDPKVNERTDDDKTLVLATRRTA
ncbi:PP2C family serine/threonine-protein phosphatase [Burkholderia sp. Bp9140]|uniref:PP2C family serine/threonine-protein phosphatase n=1 Tax=Burkholderia sp. Bp9140 TaxID=2184572 RepID=UPI0016279214|nr:PP2C family serine/threonine-protein phosphatase [Burkholderia sp. Bp9140]